ncbi:MAG TPA: TetR family transcriptional regulator C-terminal domain-containing protein, partial [Steroidobacteraceae bacterium]|nr:TetR family transcriptional regulator C-terminal domain-containing protein [Steroidobacteraceae bacterium]
MSEPPAVLAEPSPERGTRQRQRQRLIDACIAALHIHGPSRTTVEKVVALAGLSPGIVRFYFDSKDALLVASLAYLAAEFEERVLVPVGQLRETPVRALERLVDLYLDPEIASPRKVSVWYSFWGEASARQEYQDICGKKDDEFAALVRDLIERLIAETGQVQLDADAIALGLIGVLEVLWQTIAFQEESELDREAARARSLAYLNSVFPGRFSAARGGGAPAPHTVPPATSLVLPATAYADAALLALERERLLRPSWQLLGHRAEVAHAGDYLARDVAAERVLLIRDASGLHAFRNACPHRPHALLEPGRGHLGRALECRTHGLRFGLDGRAVSDEAAPSLMRLRLHADGALIWVRAQEREAMRPPAIPELPASWKALEPEERDCGADWKLFAEQWLEMPVAGRVRGQIVRRVLPPNQLLELAAHHVHVLQLIPLAPGRTRLRCFRYA